MDRVTSLPTPPLDATELDDFYATSTIFGPKFLHQEQLPDLCLKSSDDVLFHIHRHTLSKASSNDFGGLVSNLELDVAPTPLAADVLEVLLQAAYGLNSNSHSVPSLDTLVDAIDLFPRYGLDARLVLAPQSTLYEAIRFQTPLAPFRIFALASRQDLEDLAVAASGYLLAFPLMSITDKMAEAVKPKYLHRLFTLHLSRSNALKSMVFEPLEHHPNTVSCTYQTYEALSRAWLLAGASLIWDADANTSATTIQRTLLSLESGMTCPNCKKVLNERVRSIVLRWTNMKSTI